MAYARFNEFDSEVYVWGGLHLECSGCQISGPVYADGNRYGSFSTDSRTEMVNHLLDHRADGYIVPEFALARLRQEIEDIGDEY